MFLLARDSRIRLPKNQVVGVWVTTLFGMLVWAACANAQTVVTYSFEDGAADGWSSFFGATTPVASNAAAYAGSYSLLTTHLSGKKRREGGAPRLG